MKDIFKKTLSSPLTGLFTIGYRSLQNSQPCFQDIPIPPCVTSPLNIIQFLLKQIRHSVSESELQPVYNTLLTLNT